MTSLARPWKSTGTKGTASPSRFTSNAWKSSWPHCSIPFRAQEEVRLTYREQPLKHTYVPDLICHGQIIVELKAVKELADEHRAQLLNYLKATGRPLGLLVNFGHHPGLQWERLVF